MDLFTIHTGDLFSFLLTLMRISLVVFMLPLFGADNLPAAAKGALCIVLTAALWSHLHFAGSAMPAAPIKIILMLLSEVILGSTLGLLVKVSFTGVRAAGELIATQMGFSMASVTDPSSGEQQTALAQVMYIVAMLIFLSLDGHLLLLRSLADTFTFIPPGGLVIKPFFAKEVFSFTSNIFIYAIKIAAPVLTALFLVELALALMARAAPQMNLLAIGFPLKIGIGMLFMGLIFFIIGHYIREFITDVIPLIYNLLRAASPL